MAERRAGAGSYGPRLIGRLTAELIMRSPQYMSCVKQYEIDLRGAGGQGPCTRTRVAAAVAAVGALGL